MPDSHTARHLLRPAQSSVFQGMAIAVCVLLSLAMIANTQLGGEAMWFWYTTLFHQGHRLYSDMHTPLQPLFVLETDAWMRMFGVKSVVMEIPSLLHATALAGGMYLLLRESRWPDWQKALVLAGAFVTTVVGNSYRFDDYHVVAENLILYSLLLLLLLARAGTEPLAVWLTVGLGLLTGMTVTTRLTDGAALLVSVGLSLLIVARRWKLLLAGLYVVVAAVTVVVIVRLTGDTLAAWVSSTIIKAAGSKGGTGSIFAAPFLFFRNALTLARTAGKGIAAWFVAAVAVSAILWRLQKMRAGALVAVQLGLAALTWLLVSAGSKRQLLTGTFPAEMTLLLTLVTYGLAPVVAVRYLVSKRRGEGGTWDAREILVALPLAEWASYSAGAAGEPHTGYYEPVALLLLLVPVVQPFRRLGAWANASFVTLLALLAFTGITSKVLLPYSWQNYDSSAMFRHRQWFRHPVYGPLYIDDDLLRFSTGVCGDMRGAQAPLELLSLPYPYPNYFCAAPPWHEYVQTFFDTSTRATINHLMSELRTAPPQWIVYQRQIGILSGAERLYNHGQPLAQRDLDSLILEKIASGQWTLVDKREYLVGDGWYVIRTRP